MIRIGLVENYTIRFKKSRKIQDKILIADITPKTEFEKDVFSDTARVSIAIPQVGAVTYNSKFPDKYNLLIQIDDDMPIRDDLTTFIFAYPVPKNLDEFVEDASEPAPLHQVASKSELKPTHKSIKSEDGESLVGVSDNGIVLKSGKNTVEVSRNGIAFAGKTMYYDLPAKSHGIVAESKLLSLLPKAFVPPFSTPHYLPSTDLVRMGASLNKAVSKLMKIKPKQGV